MITANDVSVRLGNRIVLKAVTLGILSGGLTVVIGPNGAGKTTLLRTLVGDLAPTRGSVVFEGKPVARWRGSELANRRAVLSQSAGLSFPFSVYEVVALGLRGEGDGPRRVLDALTRVGLPGYEGRYYQQLSGGQQQRVQLARVLCQIAVPRSGEGANWLFLDEPTASLDIRHQFQILDLARAHARGGGGALAILHDLNLAHHYADRLIVIDGGGIAADGHPGETLSGALVEKVFGVSASRVLNHRRSAE